ncbi:MAG TPA: hypothetical protein VFA04_22715, partial [Bryobacteraceae bacterium]|nr:hypothetical protein [Bryobacteraceae bacterium]
MRRSLAILALAAAHLPAAEMQPVLSITRAVRPWEFVDAAGPRSGIWGAQDGTMEAWVYPLKICRDLRFEFRVDNQPIPGAAIAREVSTSPGRFSLTFTGDNFRVIARYAAAADSPGALIYIEAHSTQPLEIRVRFRRDFQLMWPASMGTTYAQWDKAAHAYRFGADGYPYAAVLGSPDAILLDDEYATNYSTSPETAFSLGVVKGDGAYTIAIAGSMKSRDDAFATYEHLLADPPAVLAAVDAYYQQYLARTVSLDLPDRDLQRAYDWSRISMFEGLVENPLMGRGLVAGIGPSKGVYRPGFAWFFGRDSFWTSFALISSGDFQSADDAIRFIAKFQREDGKIPHEISQSAALLDWFKQFPYGYASADATPLFVIIVRDYTEASGDPRLATDLWPRLQKAMDFMRANADPLGFPKNYEVGHGWIEGGPMLPVRTEYYQAALGVEALRSMSVLARLHGDAEMASSLDADYRAKRSLLDETYWDMNIGAYSYAINVRGEQKHQTYSIATVPMWFDLADPAHAQREIELLSDEAFEADWGARIISRHAANYGPEGYHYGTVWPLFTGWASVGEYRYHAAQSGWANLQANAELTMEGLGNTTEVVSGMTYSPLSTASPHQIWSAAMVVSPLLRGLFGLSVDAAENTINLRPHLPASWDHFGIMGIHAGESTVDLSWRRVAGASVLHIANHGEKPVTIHYAPALARTAEVRSADLKYERGGSPTDWHPVFEVVARPGTSDFHMTVDHDLGYELDTSPLQLGSVGE